MGNITRHQYDPDNREAWLELRSSLDKIGGSEIGILAGHNTYSSPYALFCEKTGIVDRVDVSDKEAVRQGHDLEQYVAERFESISGKKVTVFPYILTNTDCPHLEATIDRKILDEDSGLECKTMQSLVMNKFPHGDFPLSYYDQCVSYLAVSELTRWYLAILVFGTAFKVFCMTTDREEYELYERLKAKVDGAGELTDAEQKEWESRFGWLVSCCYVSPEEKAACETIASNFMARVYDFRAGNLGAWPLEEIDGSEATTEALKRAIPFAKEKSVVTFDETAEYGVSTEGEVFTAAKSEDVIALIRQRMEIADTIKALEEEEGSVENRIIAIMQDKETFKTPVGNVSFKNQKPRETPHVDVIKSYFAAKGEPIPYGMITIGEGKRSLRFSRPRK